MNSKPDYIAKRIGTDELALVQEVFDGTRNIKTEEAFYRQKFKGKAPIKFISVMHFDGEKPISHCVAIPYTFINAQSERIVGAQVCDAVTLPDYQRKGLFSSLNEEILNHAIEEKVDFLFRFPSAHNYKKVIGKFGFTHTDDFHTFEFNFRFVPPVLKIFQKFNWNKLCKRYLKFVSRITFSVNTNVPNSLLKGSNRVIEHDEDYFKYKTYSPSFKMNIFGDKYWVSHDDGLVVGDVNLRSNKRFMTKLKVFSFIFGIHKVRFKVCGQSEEFTVMSKLTKPQKDIPICTRLLNEDLDISTIRYTYADGDTF